MREKVRSEKLAEREGFEPPIPFRVCRFSRPEPSTTRPPLRLIQFYYSLNFTAGGTQDRIGSPTLEPIHKHFSGCGNHELRLLDSRGLSLRDSGTTYQQACIWPTWTLTLPLASR